MKATYLVDESFPLPDFDKQISIFVEQYGPDPWGATNCYVGIEYGGVIYRKITCEGLTEYIACVNFLADLNLKDLYKDIMHPVKGYDSLFV